MSDLEKLPEYTFWEHVEELRKRILISAVWVAVSGTLVFTYSAPIMEWLVKPFSENFDNFNLVGLAPSEGFTVRILLALWLGLIISSPIILHQIWAFIRPGLYNHEKKVIKGVLFYAIFLFLLGVLFSYYIITPFALSFFYSQYQILDIKPTIRMVDYLSFLMKLSLGSGIVFLTPVACYCLAVLDLLTSQFLISNFRFFIVGIFILAAVLTPPDVLTQVILALPLLALYGASILIVKFVEKK